MLKITKFLPYLVFFVCFSCNEKQTKNDNFTNKQTAINSLIKINSIRISKRNTWLLEKLTKDDEWSNHINYVPTAVKIFETLDDFPDSKAGNMEINFTVLFIGNAEDINLNKQWLIRIGDENISSSSVTLEMSSLGSELVGEKLAFLTIAFKFDATQVSSLEKNTSLMLLRDCDQLAWQLLGESATANNKETMFFEKYLDTKKAFIAERQRTCEVHYGIHQPLNVKLHY